MEFQLPGPHPPWNPLRSITAEQIAMNSPDGDLFSILVNHVVGIENISGRDAIEHLPEGLRLFHYIIDFDSRVTNSGLDGYLAQIDWRGDSVENATSTVVLAMSELQATDMAEVLRNAAEAWEESRKSGDGTHISTYNAASERLDTMYELYQSARPGMIEAIESYARKNPIRFAHTV